MGVWVCGFVVVCCGGLWCVVGVSVCVCVCVFANLDVHFTLACLCKLCRPVLCSALSDLRLESVTISMAQVHKTGFHSPW